MSETTLNRSRDVGGAIRDHARTARTPLLYGVRISVAVSLALFLAFWLQLDNPNWAGTSAVIVCQPVLGASIRKGAFRLVGTVIGATATVILTAVFPQDRLGFFAGLALWSAACSFASTVLRNFAAYSAMLAGYTMSIIAGSSIAAPDNVFILAVNRASEIGLGIVCGMLVMSLTEFGTTASRLSNAIAALCTDLLAGLRADLAAQPDADFATSQRHRRDAILEVASLDPLRDQVIGESGEIGVRETTLRAGINGLLLALSGWRSIAVHLGRLTPAEAHRLAGRLEKHLRAGAAHAYGLARADAPRLAVVRDDLAAAALTARTRPADNGSDRLLLDRLASFLEGISRAVNALVLTVEPSLARTAKPLPLAPMPDPLPPLVNAARVFVAIVAGALLYVATSWDSGLSFLTFLAVTVILLSPQDERAGKAAVGFGAGTILAACLAATVKFAVLPNHESFLALGAGMALVLVPLGALSTRPALAPFLVPAVMNFVPLLGPTNEITFDTLSFYNGALGIVGGCVAGSLILWLIPPVPPALRARRLLALTRADLRTLARRPHRWSADAWRARVYARIGALPTDADLADGARLLSALNVGLNLMALRAGPSPAAAAACARALSTGDLDAIPATVDRPIEEHGASDPAAREDRLRAAAALQGIADILHEDPGYFGTRG